MVVAVRLVLLAVALVFGMAEEAGDTNVLNPCGDHWTETKSLQITCLQLHT